MNNNTKTIKDGICHLIQPQGRTLSWSEDSGLQLLERDGFFFKDLERTGELLPYEDWRLSAWERARDLAGRLSIPEIAGLMLYSPHQMVPPITGGYFEGTFDGKTYEESGKEPFALSDQQKEFLEKENIRHILLTTVESARVSALWSNALQSYAEKLPHGIPVNLSSDPRHGSRDSGVEFRIGNSDVSKWPEGLGFAACFDPEVVAQFGHDASKEYRALGITTALGPQIDLCTEPRWMRLVDTLGEETEDVKKLVKAYCDGMQTTDGSTDGWGHDSVNTMVKHWPGGGTGEGGRDAHYPFGQYAVYPAGNFEEHLKPFTEAAFALDGPTGSAAAVMPYYSVSWGMDKKNGKNVGNSYSEYLINDLLRGEYAYQGVVCTDWGITGDPGEKIDLLDNHSYGMQDLTESERCLVAIINGVDQFGGNSKSEPIMEAYEIGCKRYGEKWMRERMELSAARLLKNIFQCGLFEDPYLDPDRSEQVVGNPEFCTHGYEAQCKSIVLLKNRKRLEDGTSALPLQKGLKIYVPNRSIGPSKTFIRTDQPAYTEDPLPEGLPEQFGVRVENPEDADVALVFVESPACNPYSEEDLAAGGNGYLPITLQYRPYTAEKAREISIAGGDFRENFTNRSYRGKTNVAYNESDLDNILECRRLMGEKPVIVCVTASNPMVMGEFEPEADGIVVEFGVSKAAVLDVIFGNYNPSGRLPIQMPKNMETVEIHCEDKAMDIEVYVDETGNAYDYGFGLRY